ncbi:MAG: methyltransferase domain-containing protein [Proteobacteria bacterium]|nr:methyltransferase domain-containing protein [Pseudomonadota bacterium]
MEEVSAGSQITKIRNYHRGFIATHLINIGAKLGVFEALNEAKEGMAISDLASKLELHEPYLKIWCETAYGLEILDCDDQGRFKLQPFLDEILGDRSHFRNYLGNIALSVDIIGKMLEDYPEYFKTGTIVETVYTPELSQAVSETTKNVSLVFFFRIFPKNDQLRQMLERGVRFLDIGCGSGNLIIQLAQAFGKSTFVGVDPDAYGIEEARGAVSQRGLADRVCVENIGSEALPYAEEFDLASMVVTLHEIRPEIRMKAIENAYRALKAGGYLLILDFPYPSELEDFRNPMYDFGVLDQFFEACAGFIHLNMDEQNQMLTKAGFKNIQRIPIGKGMFEFVTAVK